MRKSRFEDVSYFGRTSKGVTSFKSNDTHPVGLVRIFTLDGLFWRVSALLSDLDAAVEKRLLSA